LTSILEILETESAINSCTDYRTLYLNWNETTWFFLGWILPQNSDQLLYIFQKPSYFLIQRVKRNYLLILNNTEWTVSKVTKHDWQFVNFLLHFCGTQTQLYSVELLDLSGYSNSKSWCAWLFFNLWTQSSRITSSNVQNLKLHNVYQVRSFWKSNLSNFIRGL